jgi:hypothetical protein
MDGLGLGGRAEDLGDLGQPFGIGSMGKGQVLPIGLRLTGKR